MREPAAGNDPPQHNLLASADNDRQAAVPTNDAEEQPTQVPVQVQTVLATDEASESSYVSSDSDANHPSKNYSKRDLYDKLTTAKEACKDLKSSYSQQARELKAARRELNLQQRKLERLDQTESRLRKACQDLHQAKVDKKILADKA